MTLGPHTVVGRAEVLWRTVLDGVLVRVRGSDDTVLLAGTGVALWRVLDEPTPVRQVVERLAAEHGASSERVAADLDPVLDDLIARGVLRAD
ncbi:MAG: PqqD family protein [Acidimicrobiales bacterium]